MPAHRDDAAQCWGRRRKGATLADIDLRWSERIGRSCMHVQNWLNFGCGRGILRPPGQGERAVRMNPPGVGYIKPLRVAR